MTILMTTHVMGEVDELCDVVAILHQGRLAAYGSPAQLKNAVGDDATMTDWLRAVARANPLTYLVDALRMLMIEGGQGTHSLLMNFTVLGTVFVVFVVVAARLYPTLIE